MAVENYLNGIMELTGLGLHEMVPYNFGTTTTIATKAHTYQTQAVADTDEALDLGGVSTVELILIKCIANDVDIDTSYVSSFNAEITVNEGEWAIFKPTGVVRIKNDDSAEQSTIEAWILGSD